MATILMNVSKKKFNKCFTMYGDYNYHIINESSRKTLCNLFDALGNISSYNDYNAFMEKYSGFNKFNKCTVSKYLKTPIELSQGILVVVDSKTSELSLPTRKQLDWFLDKYQYSTYVIVSDDREESKKENNIEKEEPEKAVTPDEKPQEESKTDETNENNKTDETNENNKTDETNENNKTDETKTEPVKSSGGFWSYFGWN